MKINKPIKILIGILTGINVLFPFVIAPMFVMLIMFSTGFPFLDPQFIPDPNEFSKTLMPIMMVFYPFMMCFSLVQLALQITYVIHEVLNKKLTDTYRVLFIIGTFFIPYIAMPIYYFLYMLKDNSYEQDLEKQQDLMTPKE